MNTLLLSGWAQPPAALSILAPDANALDYAATNSFDDALTLVSQQQADTVIGWSLGGHLAVHAIARGLLKPKKLVLLGTPFQFVENDMLKMGMKQDTYAQFHDNYTRDAKRTLSKGYALIALGDKCGDHLHKHLQESRDTLPPHDWLYWLETLGSLSGADLDFSHFPPTILIQGMNDAVVNVSQAHLFEAHLPHATVHTLPDCGHAPHWHAPAQVKAWIEAA